VSYLWEEIDAFHTIDPEGMTPDQSPQNKIGERRDLLVVELVRYGRREVGCVNRFDMGGERGVAGLIGELIHHGSIEEGVAGLVNELIRHGSIEVSCREGDWR
jgi:hypothetical protein